jgi:predicted ATPase/DNA-binding winged helix-turn-helix (wHTH) protein
MLGVWEVDLGRRELRAGGAAVPIGGRAFDIIEVLLRAGGELVAKQDIMAQVWPGSDVGENTLQVHISAVRKALGGDRDLLKTGSGRGYRLLGEWFVQDRELPGRGAEPGGLLPAPEAVASNLPVATSGLVGRGAAVEQLRDFLSAYRVVTLTGPGGIGKTSLALEVARGLLPAFQGNIWLVELASLADPSLVPSAVAAVLGLKFGGGDISAEFVARAIGRGRLLLVLDNCEHVIDAAAGLAETIVHLCPHTAILATSREVLRADGEQVYRVPPLEVPPAEVQDPQLVLQHSAVELLLTRARASQSDFSASRESIAAIVEICRHLDGIPLALEFAAARAAALGLPEVASRLDDRFGLLTGGRRTALPRQQTLRATLDWSYDLLPAGERALLRRLAIFPAGFTIAAAAAVVRGAGTAIAEGIANLVAKSLISFEGASTDRWRLLETVRAYALEKLTASGEINETARFHAEFFRDLLKDGASEGHAREIDNIRAALDWSFAATGDAGLGAELTAATVPIWIQFSLLGECRARVETALAALDRDAGRAPRTEMMLRAALGMSLSYTRGPVSEAEAIWERVLGLARRLDDAEYQLRALYGLWLFEVLVCNYKRALELARQFQRIAEGTANAVDAATADRMMSLVLHYLGDLEGSRVCAERALRGPTPANPHVYTTRYGADQRVGALVQLARALWLQGFPDQAMQVGRDSVDEAVALGHANSLCLALADGAGMVALLAGDRAAGAQFEAMLTEHAGKHALGVWRTYGRALRGYLRLRGDEAGEGIALLRSALDDLRDTPLDIRLQLYLTWLAEALMLAGQPVEGLTAIDQVLQRAEQTGERWNLPELLRIRGELLLRQDGPRAEPEARGCFAHSLELARGQGALGWELRTAMSLARAAQGEGARRDASAMLRSVVARFTEGLATADLVAARGLL